MIVNAVQSSSHQHRPCVRLHVTAVAAPAHTADMVAAVAHGAEVAYLLA
ncbi:hypothetical protein GH825_29260 [Bacillus thuringiensis]|nr:hypothetical protein [Bacillus thuringiensis]